MDEYPDENRENRQQKLKEIVKDLHEGSDIKAIQRKFADLIRDVSPQEIAEMEQALVEEGVPVEQVQKVCDVHVQVFEETLKRQRKEKTIPGHPVHTYSEENKVARQICRKIQKLLRNVPKGKKREEFEKHLGQLRKIEIHFQRKENQLFPVLESVGFIGPSKVMWGKHDEIRAQLRDFESSYQENDWGRFKSSGRAMLRAIRRMIFMEEKILFPTASKKLSDEQWAEIRKGEAEIGYAWIQPGNLWDPSVVIHRGKDRNLKTHQTVESEKRKLSEKSAQDEISLNVGSLSGEQIDLLLRNLPVDVTYVDEHDTVRYYSQGKERIFPRSSAIIGREVQNCHPPKSVHIVENILMSFKKKEKDVAEFWITLNDRFIHIRYFALYDQKGDYKGVIEVSQDVTDIRCLKGEKRLPDW